MLKEYQYQTDLQRRDNKIEKAKKEKEKKKAEEDAKREKLFKELEKTDQKKLYHNLFGG
ncbi:MAG: hypothetical protein LBS61_01310 [Endomicrobium sp.]|jgi:hypothetical protein|nr:hypothetical protein [Endomicrobium sp.]